MWTVTTRTPSPIQHTQFALRFSDLAEIEEACREDEEERANRTIDWISSRVSERAAKWVEIMDRAKSEGVTTPWWEELKKCTEGNVVPSRTEGWNHPVASEQLQKVRQSCVSFGLTSESSHLCRIYDGCEPSPGSPGPTRKTYRLTAMGRPHVSSMHTHYPMRDLITLRPNVCAHRQGTSFERLNFNYARTESLFNAVKKQYGNSHLLKLTLPSPPPPGVPSPVLLPRLPNDPENVGPDVPQPRAQAESFSIKMIETDLASTARFVRELAVESLIPWMGKCVLEWNEAVSLLFVSLNLRA